MSSLRSSLLISVPKLKEIIQRTPPNSKTCRILDASWHLPNTGRKAELEYEKQHIPGALYFDIDACAETSQLPHMIPKSEVFEAYVGKLGVSNSTHVILYDNNPQFPLFSAQRVWWTFRLFGHENVSILEGGLQKWLAEGGETTSEIPSISAEKFTAKFDQSLIKYYEDIEGNIDKSNFTLVDARPEGRFNGTSPEPRQDTKPGCIPKSVNIPFMVMMNKEQGTVKSTEELKAIFETAGVDLNKPMTVSCGSGISACILALSAYLCGKKDVAVYDGAWTEWYQRAPAHLKKNVPQA